MIYSYALSVKDVYPYRKTQQKKYNTSGLYWYQVQFTHPAVCLLSTCRIIRQEAEPVLYSRNVIHLPVSILTQRFFDTALHNPERRSWVKRICVRFRSDDLVSLKSNSTPRPLATDISTRLVGEDTSDILQSVVWRFRADVHDALKQRLWELVWPRKVRPILEHLKLDSIALDFYECSCTERCCILAGCALRAFEPGFAHGTPKRTEIWDECDMLHTAARHCDAVEYVESLMGHWTAQRLQLPTCDKEDMAANLRIFGQYLKM